MRNAALYLAGLILGVANGVRHRRQGYVTPRPFTGEDADRAVEYAIQVVDRLEKRANIDWRGARVLEVGPGPDLATGGVILSRGATSYGAVDGFDNRGQAHAKLYERLSARLDFRVDPDALGFTLTSFPGLDGLDGAYDIVISNATLEHLRDLGPFFRSLHRVTAPGPRMVHHVDAQTHIGGSRTSIPSTSCGTAPACTGGCSTSPEPPIGCGPPTSWPWRG